MPTPLSGGCLCGRIRYTISPPDAVYNMICHCVNCKKATGTHMLNASIFTKSQFILQTGSNPKVYNDPDTDSGHPLQRYFCGDCGSPVYVTSPAVDGIVLVLSGTMDDGAAWWSPNKEQYIESKSHWLPELPLVSKDGVAERHSRGPPREQELEPN